MAERVALLIGINNYSHSSGLVPLKYAEIDAQSLAGVLKEKCGFHTQTLLGNQATRDAIEQAIYNCGRGDVFLFFFAGHGQMLSGQYKLHPVDSTSGGLKAISFGDISRQWQYEFGYDRVIAILDACRSELRGMRGGRGFESSAARDIITATEGERWVEVLYGCREGEVSYEIDELGHGLMTKALLDVLENLPGELDTGTLAGAAADWMRRWCRKDTQGRRQEAYRYHRPSLEQRIVLLGGSSIITPPQPQIHIPTSKKVVCPLCGIRNYEDDTFKCMNCGRDYLCRKHHVEEKRCCEECASKAYRLEEEKKRIEEEAVEKTILQEMIEVSGIEEQEITACISPQDVQEYQKVAKCGVRREKNYLYYVDKQGDISRMGMIGSKGKKPQKAVKCGVKRVDGYMYFVDKKGDISRFKQLPEYQGFDKVKDRYSYNQPILTPQKFTNSIDMKFVLIPAGTFLMGSPSSEKDRDSNETRHKVTLTKDYYLQTTEVTQGQYEKIMGEKPIYFKGGDLPAEWVSWNDAVEFCKRLSQKEEKEYRLPTEAEWEYACRAGTTTPFYFGDTISTDQANYNGNSTYGSGRKGVYREKTTEVGSFPANSWGLYDMHGNVWEWCNDWLGEYPVRDLADPSGPNSGNEKVLRGGSWVGDPYVVRTAYRGRGYPDVGSGGVGFRCARTP